MSRYFVTAIDTDSGKTVISAIITEMLKADYWKPIQSGYPRDTETVEGLVSNDSTVFHPEGFLLNTPASPHASAKIDGVNISLENFQLPLTEKDLVIEGAGGCLVPVNDEDVVADLIKLFQTEVVLVSNLYLGSINHTLLTAAYLADKGYPVKGIIFNGEANEESQRIILKRTGFKELLHVKKEERVDKGMIRRYAKQLEKNWS